jgi:hypothetical protein
MVNLGNYLHPLVHTTFINQAFLVRHCLRNMSETHSQKQQRVAFVLADSWTTRIPGMRNSFRVHEVWHIQPFASGKASGKRNSNSYGAEVKNEWNSSFPQAQLRTAGCSSAVKQVQAIKYMEVLTFVYRLTALHFTTTSAPPAGRRIPILSIIQYAWWPPITFGFMVSYQLWAPIDGIMFNDVHSGSRVGICLWFVSSGRMISSISRLFPDTFT